MEEYTKAKSKPLTFKGGCLSEKEKRENARRKLVREKDVFLISDELIEESKRHEGWWIIDRLENAASGKVCFEHESGAFITCLDSGELALGMPHDADHPAPSGPEIFTLSKTTDGTYGIKTCFG